MATARFKAWLGSFVAMAVLRVAASDPGSSAEPLRYVGPRSAVLNNPIMAKVNYHDGQLRPVVGVQSYEVMHANRKHPELSDGFGWTYNHQAYLVYWKGRFYYQYLSCPETENEGWGQTLVTTSVDGVNWPVPTVIFPGQILSGRKLLMHQRMGFHQAADGRLLVLGFYSKLGDPNAGVNGIGRVVCEAYTNGTYGPIYYIRYNTQNGWNPDNSPFYPYYTASSDQGFVKACSALATNRLVTLQWYEEDRAKDGFFALAASGKFTSKAPSIWHRRDGTAVSIFKEAYAALSSDEGLTWSTPVQLPTIPPNTSKYWGQRTRDGRYALVYNPRPNISDGPNRYPLAVITSDDGILFDNLVAINGEMPPPRFFRGRKKGPGPQYVRGIAEWNGQPPGKDMWVAYSMHKESMWISRVPVPIRSRMEQPVNDDFENMTAGGLVTNWNIFSPKWSPAAVVANETGRCLQLRDEDPYDYAKVVRVFPESMRVTVAFKMQSRQNDTGEMHFEVTEWQGKRPVRLVFNSMGRMVAQNGDSASDVGAYHANQWYAVEARLDLSTQRYDLVIGGNTVLTNAQFAESVASVERLEFRTGRYRLTDVLPDSGTADASNPDDKAPLAVYDVDDVVAKETRRSGG